MAASNWCGLCDFSMWLCLRLYRGVSISLFFFWFLCFGNWDIRYCPPDCSLPFSSLMKYIFLSLTTTRSISDNSSVQHIGWLNYKNLKNTLLKRIAYTDLLFGKWGKCCIIFHTSNNVKPHSLLSKNDFKVFILVKKFWNIKTCFFHDLHLPRTKTS